ncbi:hypothetical protein Tco_0585088 [Tanacetum coccineum]
MSADSTVPLPYFHSEDDLGVYPSVDPWRRSAPTVVGTRHHVLRRLLLTTPRPSCEVRESSAAAVARQPGPTMAHRVDYSLVDVRSRESSEFYSRHHDAQKDRAAVRAEIEVLRRERLAYEQESMETRQALARSEAYCRALEARVTVLETEVRRHEWQRQAADDFAVRHIMRTQALEAGARVDTLEDTENGTKEKDHEVNLVQHQHQSRPSLPLHLSPHATNSGNDYEGVTAALAARDATRNGNDSHTSGTGARRPMQVARECTYPDFLKFQPLKFNGTKGVVGLTQWFEKMESVYSISNYTVACQVKFAMCTLQGNALTWWNSHVKTNTPEAAHAMP